MLREEVQLQPDLRPPPPMRCLRDSPRRFLSPVLRQFLSAETIEIPEVGFLFSFVGVFLLSHSCTLIERYSSVNEATATASSSKLNWARCVRCPNSDSFASAVPARATSLRPAPPAHLASSPRRTRRGTPTWPNRCRAFRVTCAHQ